MSISQKSKKKLIISVSTITILLIALVTALLISSQKETKLSDVNELEAKRYLAYNEITDADAIISNCEYVQFNSFFIRDVDGDGYAEKYDGTCNQLSKRATLYFDINVLTDGKLEGGKISILGKNFNLSTALVKDSVIQNDYIGSNITEIGLNTIQYGTQKLFSGSISSSIGNNTKNYSVTDNKVILTGTWVSTDGTRSIPIRKEITLQTDWYGRTSTSAYQYITTTHNINTILGTDGVTLSFDVGYTETAQELIIQKQITEVTIPDFNEFAPLEVTVNSSNCNWEYDESTRKLTITREATVNEDGLVTKSVSRTNTYNIHVKYPLEAYDNLIDNVVRITVPTIGYYYGYNNSSEEYKDQNPYISSASRSWTHVWQELRGVVQRFDVYVGRYVYNPDTKSYRYLISKEMPLQIYNNLEQEEGKSDEYIVEWRGYAGQTPKNQSGMYMREYKTDEFLNSAGQYSSMANYIHTKGVYFSGVDGILADDGWLRVYDDESGETLLELTKKDFNRYTSSNPYYFDKTINKIRVETSKANDNSYLYVYQIKEINDEKLTTDYTLDQFDNLNYIYSYMNGGLYGDTHTMTNGLTDQEYAYYEAPVSLASFTVSPYAITNQETKAVTMRITTESSRYNESLWKNGYFVLEMPEEILELKVNDVKSSNSSVEVTSYEVYEENGKQYMKIYTKNDTETTFYLTIDAELTADPRKPTVNKSIKLYGINPHIPYYRSTSRAQDVLDINNNGNRTENVLYKTASLQIVAPSSLNTSQTLSEFDDKGTEVVSPQTAILDKSSKARDAKINVTLVNNYSGTISETVIVGQIPFEGNRYQINGKELGSTYSVTMKNTGIQVPADLAGIVKLYYSTNSVVNGNISDSSNNWKTADQVTDWSQIKTYAIDLGSHVLQKGETRTFSYGIVIPNNINYNDVSYSTHGIYFCLDTEDGKLRTQTEVNRLGIMIAKKFDISLTKYKQGTNTKVAGATYRITDGTNSRTGITNENGIATVSGLYVDKEYTLEEIASPDNYVLNDKTVKFKVTADNEGNPHLTTTGEIKGAATLENIEGTYVVSMAVEDVAKYDVKLVKKDGASGEMLKGVKFRLTGGTYGDFGRIFTTNADGEISIINLIPGITYTLQETKATGYYVDSSEMTFTVTRNATGNLIITSNKNEIKNASINEVDGVDKAIINVELTNEKIPTYSLNINKINKDSEKLAGTQFKLSSTDTGEEFYATTNENGIATFDGIYQYVTGKYITGEYTLEEIVATEGYVTDTRPVKFKAEKDASGVLQITILEGEDVIKTHTSNSTSITFNVENKPIFKLTKTGDNGAPLANTKFKITDLNGNPATDTNGNPIGKLEGTPAINLEFASVSTGNAAWTQKPDGTWVSGNKGVQSSNSKMASKPFTLSERRTLSFEWCQSSEIGYDYVIYTIKNEDGSTFKTENAQKKFNNTNKYDNGNLQFATIEVPLPAGTYTIEFTYKKDGSGDQGDDAGYVRNAKVDGSGYYAVITDENGEITANLSEGLYQVEEIEPAEGYQLPEKLEDRIQYIGIGRNRPEESEFGAKFTKAIKGVGHSEIYDMKATSDGGYIVAGSFTGELDIDADGVVDITSRGDTDAYIVKFDKNGDYMWHYILGTTGADEFKKIDITNDGYVAVGYEYSSTYRDSVVVKINTSGTQVWKTKPVTVPAGKNAYDDELTGVKVLPDGNIVITGNFYGDEVKVGTTTHPNANQRHQGFVAWLNANGGYIRSIALTGTDVSTSVRANVNITDVTLTNRGIVVSVDYVGKLNVNGTELNTTTNQQDSVLIGYSTAGAYQWHTQITGTKTESIGRVITDNEDNIVALGGFGTNLSLGGETITVRTANASNALMLKFANDGQYVPDSAYTIGTTSTNNDNKFTSAVATDDGLLISGWFYSADIDTNGGTTNNMKTKGQGDGILIKLLEDGTVDWAKQIGGATIDAANAVAQLNDGTCVVAGSFNSTALTVDTTANALTLQGATDAFMVGFGKVVTAAEIPQRQTIEMTNELKKFKITTEIDINSDNQRTGGTITGTPTGEENINLVEQVKYGYDSISPIVITPDTNYSVYKITINDEEVQFTPGANGVVTLPIFEDVKHDYHIKVIFEKNVSSVLVHHYLKDRNGNLTTTSLAEDGHYQGKIGSDYSTSPKTEIEINGVKYNIAKSINNTGYEVVGNYALPKNRSGKYVATQTVVTYYYEEQTFNLTVHHYLEGTETSLEPDEITNNLYKDNTFETNIKNELLEEYDLVSGATTVNLDSSDYTIDEETQKVTGTVTTKDIEVTYYYKLKEYNITTKVNQITITRHNELTNEYEEMTVKGGTISGENDKPYETVIRGENSVKEIKTIPDNGYRVKKITVKHGSAEPTEIEFTPNDDGSVTLDKFINVREDKEVTVEFEPIQGKVIVHHYIKGTTNPVFLEDGTTAKDEEKIGYVGDPYATKRKENLAAGFIYDSVVGETSGKYIDGQKEVTYYYEALTDIDVTKNWDNTNNIYTRPDSVTIELMANGKKVDEIVMTKENKVTIEGELENEETWQYTFVGKPKYDDSGKEIVYTVREK